MKIREATYVTEMVERRKELTPEAYGCDECRHEIPQMPNEPNRLELTVFNKNEESCSLHFCSWACVLTHIPKVKSDYFISLPFLYYDSKDGHTRNASELIDIINSIK